MNKTIFIKNIMLCLTVLSLGGCQENTSSTTEESEPEPIVSKYKQGDTITINKDNFLDYFQYGVDAIYSYYQYVKFNIESEIKVTEHIEYFCPSLNDRVETSRELVFKSSTITDEDYLNGKSSSFVIDSQINHFEKPSSWGDERYVYKTFNVGYDFTKLNGYITLETMFYDNVVYELNNDNYPDYASIVLDEQECHGEKIVMRSTIYRRGDVLLYENFHVDCEFISFDQNYNQTKTTDFTLDKVSSQFFEFEQTPHWLINIKSVSGLVYCGNGFSD